MTNTTQEWFCGHCGVLCSRKTVRGQKPKWCSQACRWQAEKRRFEAVSLSRCEECGELFRPSDRRVRLCSKVCVSTERIKLHPPRVLTPKPPADRRSPLRRAWEEQDWPGVVEELKARSARVDDCWEWQGSIKRGYPRVNIAGRYVGAHRIAACAAAGRYLGEEHAHHSCANTVCVNPDHVIPASASINTAEMKARQGYMARISELECALREVAPDHPALGVLPVF